MEGIAAKVMKKKILLFFPNTSNRGRITSVIPILGGIAKNRGWDVVYFDTSFYEKREDSVIEKEKTGGFIPSPSETIPDMIPKAKLIPDLQALLDKFKPDVLAITAMTCDYQYLMTFFPSIKIPQNTIVIIGGIHAIFSDEGVIKSGLFDLVCNGQGEQVFDEFLSRVEQNQAIDNIQGTLFRNKKSGRVKRNGLSRLLSADELWRFPLDYSYFDARYYLYPFDGKSVNMFWLEVGRGCPFNCSYCGAPMLRTKFRGLGNYFGARPLDSIFETIKQVNQRYPIDIYNITHECFLMQPKAWLEEFVDRWAKDVRKSFLIQTRVESITKENLALLKRSKAPIIQIGLGIESGSKRILEKICNRRMQMRDLIVAYRLMREQGFRTNAYYMIGFPTETREEIFKTITLCKKLRSDINSVSILQPFPKLPITQFCIEQGFIKGNEEIPSFTEVSILKMPSISSEEISNLRRTFMLYAKLPKRYWPDIEKCEKDIGSNQDLFDSLVKLRWEQDSRSLPK